MNAPIHFDALLAPVADEDPCGEDMEYTPDFADFLAAAAGKPEQQVGDTVVPASEPDWSLVARLGGALLARTRDLRVATRLAQAWLHAEGLAGLRAGLVLIRQCVEDHWDCLYPRLDPEDGFDPAIRVNALAVLCHLGAVVHPLREVPLLHSAAGRPISLNAIAHAHGNDVPIAQGGPAWPEREEIATAFDNADRQALEAVAGDARQASEAAAAIECELGRHAGAAQLPDFEPLMRVLADIHAAIANVLANRREPQDVPPIASVDDALAAAPPASPGVPAPAPPAATLGPLQNRDDVLRGLDEMCCYYRQHEPSHPVPILLARARRWIQMDFMDLLRDLAPEAVGEAEKLRGASHAD